MSEVRPSWRVKLDYEDPTNGIPNTITVAWGQDQAVMNEAALKVFEALTADNLGLGRMIAGSKPRITHATDEWRKFMVYVQAEDTTVSLTLGVHPDDWQD